MAASQNRHQKLVALALGLALFLLCVVLGSETAFNLKFIHPRGSTQIIIFSGLSLLVFLLLVTLLILLFRNILKLYADQKSHALGSRLRTRMMLGALLLSFAPVVTMFLFSYVLMNRSIDRWFSQPVTNLHEDADGMAEQLQHYAIENARAEAGSLAQEPAIAQTFTHANTERGHDAVIAALRDHNVTLQGGFALVFRNGTLVGSYQAPEPKGPMTLLVQGEVADARTDGEDFPQTMLRVAQRADEPILRIPLGDASETSPYVVADAPVHGGGIIVVGLPLPQGLPGSIERIRQGTRDYFSLGRSRREVRSAFFLILTLLTTAIFFASSWLALFLSRQITRPVESLADAMAEIAAGQYSFRLQPLTTNELGELASSFNHMAQDLETSRNRLDTSRAELSQANQSLQARSIEIETLLDTIPLAVLSLSLETKIVHFNRAFLDLIGHAPGDISGQLLSNLVPPESLDDVQRLLRRGHRMGLASKEIAVRTPRGEFNLSVTVASLDRHGYILVMEDVTDLLRAQKQVAWREVAQRVAHEIKNPLTPISLAAERVRRYAERGTLTQNSATVMDSADVIVRSVEVLRQLVDEFALLAQFPAAQLRPIDLNRVIEDTLQLFAGRIDNVGIVRRLDAELPEIAGDPRALQRAFANLIDNAAEAMENSLHRELTVQTSLTAGGAMAEVVIADTGAGLPEEVREHLFLPWFSTKQRGSGLGLAITSQVVQEHGGSIRAERNQPAGARFILELPLAETAASLLASSSAEEHLIVASLPQ
jgi:two-component system nitrogen regulation sensor histidine kinase NtrY